MGYRNRRDGDHVIAVSTAGAPACAESTQIVTAPAERAHAMRRADAVRDYLVSRGVPRDRIETLGMGKTQPVPGVVCDQKALKALIACLAPNRRVEVEVKGDGVVRR